MIGPALDTASAGEGLDSIHGPTRIEWGVRGVRFVADLPPSLCRAGLRLFSAWPAEADDEIAGMWEVNEGPEGYRIAGPGAPQRDFASPASALVALEFLACSRLGVVADGMLGLHGALVDGPEGGVVVVGRCGSGKSTLACALATRPGWMLMSDDAALLAPHGDRGWAASPGPRRASVRRSSFALLGDAFCESARATPSFAPTEEGFLFSPAEFWGTGWRRDSNVRAIVILERLDSELPPGGRERLAPAQAAIALAPYAHVRDVGGFGAALRQVAPVAGAIPVFEFKRGPLHEMVAAVIVLTA